MDNADDGDDPPIQHFTHQHPLNRSISPGNIVCNGCNLGITTGKQHYTCRTCHSFSLHKLCFHMPPSTAHPAHPNSKLTLAVAAGGGNGVKCRACTKTISGFYYGVGSSCYHNLCLALPLAVMIAGHPHPLKIHFSPPYDFGCDICRRPSYKGWLYRCRFCEFDAHITCAISHRIVAEENRRISSSGREILHLLQLRLGIDRAAGADLEEEMVSSQTEPLMSCSLPSDSVEKSPVSGSRVSGSRVSSVTEIPSYQFSDMCFSIDLHKSYSDGNDVVGNPVESDGGERKAAAVMAVDSGRSEAGSKNWCDSQHLLHGGKPTTTKGYGIHGGGIAGGGKKNGGIDAAVEDAVNICSDS
ncbi:hypothetical protein LINGRAHAP2_LOCUS12847 [Linum grandiflorum]